MKDLYLKKKDKIDFKLKSMERNPINNRFLIYGTNYLKIQKLINNNFEEEKIVKPNKVKIIKYMKWRKKKENILYLYDSASNLFTLNLESNSTKADICKLDRDISNLSINCEDSIMACCSNDVIYLLDTENKSIINQIERKNKWIIKDCQFSPINAYYFLLSGDGGNIYLYDIRNTSKNVKHFLSESKEIISIAWHPNDENKFCSGGMENYIRIWDVNNNFNSIADFKTSEGCYKVSFLKSNPNYIISSYQTNNYNIHLWNIKMRDIPEYRYSGHDSFIVGFDNDIEGKRIVSVDRNGLLIAHEVNKGERLLDDITTNIIKFNNNNEIYCFHDDKLQKDDFSKVINKDSQNKIEENEINIIKEEKPIKNLNENINNIYMLNFNQKEFQIMKKSPTNEDKLDKLIHLKKDTILILNKELRQYYIFTPEQIHFLFKGYIYYIEKKENVYKRTRFQSVNDLYKLDKFDDPITIDQLDFSQKLNISLSKNLIFATNHIKNYNHISIWKTLLNISEKPTFKYIFNKFIGKERKSNKKSNLNKSFQREKGYYETNHLRKITPYYLELMTNIVIKQLSQIIEYLIDDYGDLFLATIICYLFKPILFHDEKVKKRILRLIKDCVDYLRKYQLYVEANHLVKYGPEENNHIDEKSFKYNYACVKCKKCNFKDGIFCEGCKKVTSGLFLWCPLCGHEEHLIDINKNKSEIVCSKCKKNRMIEN